MKTITLLYPAGQMEHAVSKYLLDNKMMQEFDNYEVEDLGESANIPGSSVVVLQPKSAKEDMSKKIERSKVLLSFMQALCLKATVNADGGEYTAWLLKKSKELTDLFFENLNK